jgi:hypothetical protein
MHAADRKIRCDQAEWPIPAVNSAAHRAEYRLSGSMLPRQGRK